MILNGTAANDILSALLIDVDNFHDPVHLRAIHSQFGQFAGKGFACHVHGDPKQLFKDDLKPVWQELAAKLLPFLPLNKNTTDAGLIVDALMLHFKHGTRRFGIASGDADFAPLSLQLRELGCEVTCFARKSIAFEAMVSYYDRVVRFDALPVKTELPLVAPVPTPFDDNKIQKMAVTSPLEKPKIIPKAVATVPPSPDEFAIVKKILAAVPGWLPQTLKPLNQLGSPLRDAGIKTGNAPLHQLFRKYPFYFTVLPLTGVPEKIRLERCL